MSPARLLRKVRVALLRRRLNARLAAGTPPADVLLAAYGAGVFPMAWNGPGAKPLSWVDPERRGVLPLDAVHLSRSLRKTLRRAPFEVRVNSAFSDVLAACAAPTEKRPTTWIDTTIADGLIGLHARGLAHSVECWADGEMVGGLYGVAVGGAFSGESMFARRPDASKVALVHLVARLRLGGFVLLDTQEASEHMRRFGGIEVPAGTYLKDLARARRVAAAFPADPSREDLDTAMEALTSAPPIG